MFSAKSGGTHGIDIRDGIGCSNLAEVIGIINDRREKIYRLDDSFFAVEAYHCSIVDPMEIDDNALIFRYRQLTQNLSQVFWTELTGSAGAVRELCEPFGHCPCHMVGNLAVE